MKTKKKLHAADIVREKGRSVDFVTVFGGDGTIRETVCGMGGSAIPLGIIPFGTVNVLALDLGIPFHPLLAAQTIVEGFIRNIDTGTVNGTPFLLMVSTGLDATAVHNVDLVEKKLLGRLAYLFSAIRSLIVYRPRKIMLTDRDTGKLREGYLAILSNSRYYGGRFTVDPGTRIDDGLLNGLLLQSGSPKELLSLVRAVFSGTIAKIAGVQLFQGRNFRIETKKKVHAQIDGDKAPFPPFDISVRPGFLPVFVPEKGEQDPITNIRKYFRILMKKKGR